MKPKLTFILIVFICNLGLAVFSQTRNDFKAKYSQREFFEVRPEILMSAEYNSTGEVCSVRFQPNHYSEKEKSVFVGNSTLNLHDFMELFDELVPAETRKGKGESLGFVMSGNMIFGGFALANVRINVKKPPGRVPRKSELIGDREFDESYMSANKSLIEFLNGFGPPETASISWLDRKGCSDK